MSRAGAGRVGGPEPRWEHGGPAERRDGIRLGPAPGRALAWTVIGMVASGLAGWLVADTGGHALAVALLIACALVTAPPVAQLVAPGAFTWHLDDQGLVVRRLHRRLEVAWSQVALARVVRRSGDPALELHLRADDGPVPSSPPAGARPAVEGDTLTLVLPLGADLDALHRALELRLGRTGDAPAPDQGPDARHGAAAQ